MNPKKLPERRKDYERLYSTGEAFVHATMVRLVDRRLAGGDLAAGRAGR